MILSYSFLKIKRKERNKMNDFIATSFSDRERSARMFPLYTKKQAPLTKNEKWSKRALQGWESFPPFFHDKTEEYFSYYEPSIRLRLGSTYQTDYNVYGILGAMAILSTPTLDPKTWSFSQPRFEKLKKIMTSTSSTNNTDIFRLLRQHTSFFQIILYARQLLPTNTTTP